MSMIKDVKPKNARSKRALEHRAPKVVENPKTALFFRGTSCSQIVQDAMGDLFALRQPYAKKFTKKNAVRPFEDTTSLEFFSEKNDASLLVFGSTTKKRPHTLTFIRLFAHKVLDMLELSLDPTTFRAMSQFRSRKFNVGSRPMVVFAGTAFDSPVENEYTLVKSMLEDFLAGGRAPPANAMGNNTDAIDVEGLQYIITVSVPEPTGPQTTTASPSANLPIYLRTHVLNTKRSGQRLPRIDVEEMGPRMDLRIGRTRPADPSMLQEAMKRPKYAANEEKTKKNITTDGMGDKLGRIHLGRQDLSEMQSRKVKALKRGRIEGETEEAAPSGFADSKRPRTD